MDSSKVQRRSQARSLNNGHIRRKSDDGPGHGKGNGPGHEHGKAHGKGNGNAPDEDDDKGKPDKGQGDGPPAPGIPAQPNPKPPPSPISPPTAPGPPSQPQPGSGSSSVGKGKGSGTGSDNGKGNGNGNGGGHSSAKQNSIWSSRMPANGNGQATPTSYAWSGSGSKNVAGNQAAVVPSSGFGDASSAAGIAATAPIAPEDSLPTVSMTDMPNSMTASGWDVSPSGSVQSVPNGQAASSTISSGAIAAIVLGILFFVVIGAFLRRRFKRKNKAKSSPKWASKYAGPNGSSPTPPIFRDPPMTEVDPFRNTMDTDTYPIIDITPPSDTTTPYTHIPTLSADTQSQKSIDTDSGSIGSVDSADVVFSTFSMARMSTSMAQQPSSNRRSLYTLDEGSTE